MNVTIKCERCGKIITKSGDKNASGEKVDSYYDLADNCNTVKFHAKYIEKETQTGEIAVDCADGFHNTAYLCDKCYQEFKNFMKPKKEK